MPFHPTSWKSSGVLTLAPHFLQGVDISPDLARLCPALSLQQVYRLTEHQHDDWIVGMRGGTQDIVLLETLRRLMHERSSNGLAGVCLDVDSHLAAVLLPLVPSTLSSHIFLIAIACLPMLMYQYLSFSPAPSPGPLPCCRYGGRYGS